MRPFVDPGAPLFNPTERTFHREVGRLAFANPFLPERVLAQRAALLADWVDVGTRWSLGPGDTNVARIERLLRPLLGRARDRLAAGAGMADEDRGLYEDACLYLLYCAHDERLQGLIDDPQAGSSVLYRSFCAEYDRLFRFSGSTLSPPEPERVFACFFQMRRALPPHLLHPHRRLPTDGGAAGRHLAGDLHV